MSLKDDLQNAVNGYFVNKFDIKQTAIVPTTDYSKPTFGNTGLTCEFAFLFVDIRKSSDMHQTYGYETTAKLYESFHKICLKIIEANQGQVRAFDGDRIMGVFSGDVKRTNAVKAAMNVRYAVLNILNPKLQQLQKPSVKIGCGVDCGEVLVTKVGESRDIDTRDLVWIGKACNYASHLTQYATDEIIISENVYNTMPDKVKYKSSSTDKINMWTSHALSLKNGNKINVYKSSYYWGI